MFRRILVPVDGTAGSEKAVPYAIGLAKSLDAAAIICQVLTTPIAASAAAEKQLAARYVSEIAQRFGAEGISAKTQVRRGDPAIEIGKTAVDWDVDAIVMATRSRRRLEKLMLGSVADAVVRDSRLPVLLVSSRRALKSARAAGSRERLARAEAGNVDRVISRLTNRDLGPAQRIAS